MHRTRTLFFHPVALVILISLVSAPLWSWARDGCLKNSEVMAQKLPIKSRELFYTTTARQAIFLDMVESGGRYYNFRFCFDRSAMPHEIIDEGFNYDMADCSKVPFGVHAPHEGKRIGGNYGALSPLWVPIASNLRPGQDSFADFNVFLAEELEALQTRFVTLEDQGRWDGLKLDLLNATVQGGLYSTLAVFLARNMVDFTGKPQPKWLSSRWTTPISILSSIAVLAGANIYQRVKNDDLEREIFSGEWRQLNSAINHFDTPNFTELLDQNPQNFETILGLLAHAFSNAMNQMTETSHACSPIPPRPVFLEQIIFENDNLKTRLSPHERSFEDEQ